MCVLYYTCSMQIDVHHGQAIDTIDFYLHSEKELSRYKEKSNRLFPVQWATEKSYLHSIGLAHCHPWDFCLL